MDRVCGRTLFRIRSMLLQHPTRLTTYSSLVVCSAQGTRLSPATQSACRSALEQKRARAPRTACFPRVGFEAGVHAQCNQAQQHNPAREAAGELIRSGAIAQGSERSLLLCGRWPYAAVEDTACGDTPSLAATRLQASTNALGDARPSWCSSISVNSLIGSRESMRTRAELRQSWLAEEACGTGPRSVHMAYCSRASSARFLCGVR